MKLSTSVKPISYLKAHAFEQTQETLALLKIPTRSQQNVRQGKVKSLDAAFASLERQIRGFIINK